MKIFSQKLVLRHLFFIFFLSLFATLCFFTIVQCSQNPSILLKPDSLIAILKGYKSNISLFSFLALFITLQAIYYHFNKTRIIPTMLISGVSKRQLATPFYLFGALLTLFLTINYGFSKESLILNAKMTRTKYLLGPATSVYVEQLSNKETLVFNLENNEPFDLFWLKNDKSIIYCSKIKKNEDGYTGFEIEIYHKNQSNVYELTQFQDTISLPSEFFKTAQPIKNLEKSSAIHLIQMLTNPEKQPNPIDLKKIKTILLYRLSQPFYPFLLITFFLIFLFRTRQLQSHTTIYFKSILFFLLLFSWSEMALALGQLHFLSPVISLVALPIALQLFFSYKLAKA